MSGSGTRTVVVVDDDEAVRDALGALLRAAGFDVEAHADAPSFLAACGARRPGCVLLDVRMPGMDGLEALDRLSLEGPLPPVILLTGDGEFRAGARARACGAFAILEKPTDDETLLDCVRRALAAHCPSPHTGPAAP